MNTRTPIAAADLFVLLERELHRRRPRECRTCSVALPFLVDARGNGAPNWETVMIASCSVGCESQLDEIKSLLQARYALAAPDD